MSDINADWHFVGEGDRDRYPPMAASTRWDSFRVRQPRRGVASYNYWEARRQAEAEVWRRREEARARSYRLLLENLSPRQRESFQLRRRFYVRANRRWRRYLIREGSQQNVWRTILGVPVIGYCTTYNDDKPMYDLLLAQKLLIEKDERAFKKSAFLFLPFY